MNRPLRVAKLHAVLIGLLVLVPACDPSHDEGVDGGNAGALEPYQNPKSASAGAMGRTDKNTKRSGGSGKLGESASADLLAWPRDKARVLATVNGRNITLEHLVTHVNDRHFKGFKNLLSTRAGQLELQIPRMADWVRQYADVLALRAETRRLGIDENEIRKHNGKAYMAAFGMYKAQYEEKTRRPFPTSKAGKRSLENRFLKARGLGIEVEGLLNSLVSDDLTRDGVQAFYHKYSESMNGLLRVAQIFVETRDERTGALLTGSRKKAVDAKIAEIERLLKEEKVRFEDVAVTHSSEHASASRGGMLDNLNRFDPRMPAAFCRAAWNLRDGEWAGPIHTRFGTHFIKRIKWTITKMIVNPDPEVPQVKNFVHRHRKEALLFRLRKSSNVTLLY